MILLTADMLELQGQPRHRRPGRRARGAQGSRPRHRRHRPGAGRHAARSATSFVSGATWGRVRSMTDERGERITGGRPGDAGRGHRLRRAARTPATRFQVVDGRAAGARHRRVPPAGAAPPRASRRPQGRLSLEQLFSRIQEGEVKELPVVAQGRRAGLGRGAHATRSRKLSHRARSRSTSSTPASAPSRPTTCCSPRPPRRSSSASTSARSATPPSWPRRKASTSASTPSSTS